MPAAPAQPTLLLLVLLALPAALSSTGAAQPCADRPGQAAGGSLVGAVSIGAAAVPRTDAPLRHPLKGIIIEVYSAKGALLVRHEAIPGFMPGMTMMFRVDRETLQRVHPQDAITATLVERGEDYWLEDVKIIKP